MEHIRIKSCFSQDVTVVSNDFLDRFLPNANGDFVKIYLYLLRSASTENDALTLCSIADRMNCTENDVNRALRYWEKEGILRLMKNDRGEIGEIAFTSFCAPGFSPDNPSGPVSDRAHHPEPVSPKQNQQEEKQEKKEAAPLPKPSDITTERLAELGQRDEIRELFFIAQQYLNHPLSRAEMQHICYYYDNLHMSPDLVDYLLQYCISRGHSSFHYIDKVAFGWNEEGIVSVHSARKSVESYHKEYYDILKALGVDNHHPVAEEIKLMKKWLERYHFPLEIIREACTRTVMTATKPSLRYADSILSRWHTRGVKTLDDIKQLDAEHETRSAAAAARPAKGGAGSRNSFQNFSPSDLDYDELEQLMADSDNN